MIDNQHFNVLRGSPGLRSSSLLAILLFMVSGCKNDYQSFKNQRDDIKYFDLIGFIQKQMESMNSNPDLCKKLVSVNGATEEKEINLNELEQELKTFLDADINKPAWSDKYSIDSIVENGVLKELRYLAADNKLKTKELIVSFSQDSKVSEIFVKREVKSVIADTYNDMYLWPGKGYEINTVQSVALSDTTHLQVKVICPK